MGVETLTTSAVFERYGIELTRFATSLVGPADAQDVVADALLRSPTDGPMVPGPWGDRAS